MAVRPERLDRRITPAEVLDMPDAGRHRVGIAEQDPIGPPGDDVLELVLSGGDRDEVGGRPWLAAGSFGSE